MNDSNFDTLLEFFKALGNESRLRIIGLLAGGERSVGELAELLELKEPTVSHHLGMLRELGLVAVRAAGNTRYYRLDRRQLEQMNRDLFSQQKLSDLAAGAAQKWEARILQAFVQDGRLKAIPTQHKKRDVVFAWLVELFEPDRRYTEREVNEIIKTVHDDSASLRRYLVDYRYMTRESGIYWRLPDPREA